MYSHSYSTLIATCTPTPDPHICCMLSHANICTLTEFDEIRAASYVCVYEFIFRPYQKLNIAALISCWLHQQILTLWDVIVRKARKLFYCSNSIGSALNSTRVFRLLRTITSHEVKICWWSQQDIRAAMLSFW